MSRVAQPGPGDAPHFRFVAPNARVMGERNRPRPADTRRDARLPVLPMVTARQLARHPRRDDYGRPHAHRGGAQCVACPTTPPRMIDLAGRRAPLTMIPW